VLCCISYSLSAPVFVYSSYDEDSYSTIASIDPISGNVTYIAGFNDDTYELYGSLSSNGQGTELLVSSFTGTWRVYPDPTTKQWTRQIAILRALGTGWWLEDSKYLVGDVEAIEILDALTGRITIVIGFTTQFYGFLYDPQTQLLWVLIDYQNSSTSFMTYSYNGGNSAVLLHQTMITGIELLGLYTLKNQSSTSPLGCTMANTTGNYFCTINPLSGEVLVSQRITLIKYGYIFPQVDPYDPDKLYGLYEINQGDINYAYIVVFDRDTLKILSNVEINITYEGSEYQNIGGAFAFIPDKVLKAFQEKHL